jgi:hypothetical protein
MVICAPFVEVVGNVISSRVGASVFKVHDDDLGEKRLATAGSKGGGQCGPYLTVLVRFDRIG